MEATQPEGKEAGLGSAPLANAPDPQLDKEKEKIAVATPRQLMWWKFKKHRLAVISAILLVIFYLIAIFAEFVSPYDPNEFEAFQKNVPPMGISFYNQEGNLTLRPGVHGLIRHKNPETARTTYTVDKSTWYPIHFFVRERPYKLLGLFETDIHLYGLGEEAGDFKVFLLGSDELGRDMVSRIVYGARVSLSIGLVAVFLSVTLGIVLGGISGYYGGWIDLIIQRLIEF
ncbi:MAG: hypothetical protein JXB38_16295, partial [Anaerolineales bacterium]|nr:hypothetical protein [Anaerolineales bacterium]